MIQNTVNIKPIQALKDNYIWAIHWHHQAILVDPGEAKPALDWLKQQQCTLKAILITHHHWDHTGGIDELVAKHPCSVYGPSEIAQVTHPCKEGTVIDFWPGIFSVKTICIPGHTLDHIAYCFDTGIFCGDTLFSAGCGRVFEGTYAMMLESLQRINQLPDETNIYCAHEYTNHNLSFAISIEPNNEEIKRQKDVISKKTCSLPSTLGVERKINPFLRLMQLNLPSLQKNASLLERFQYLRDKKDHWPP